MDILKRHSFGLAKKGKSPKLEPVKPLKMDVVVESPPVVFYGNPTQSSGALFSCQLKIHVKDPSVILDVFHMLFLATTTFRKPVAEKCSDCAAKVDEMKKWTFSEAPLKLNKGEHGFPCSYMLPGHLPATAHGSLVTVDYKLSALALTSTGEKVTFELPIKVCRAIMPGNPKTSMRIFPPTNLKMHVTLPPVIHPIGDFTVEMRMTGVTTLKEKSQTRWRLRKLAWRIEELEKMVSPACAKHAGKIGGEGKGILHENTNVVGSDEIKSGWKTDFDDGGVIECEWRAAVNPLLKPVCDVTANNGLDVHHQMVVEMVVAEECVSNKKPNQATPTGAARVLRTQFKLCLTERSGLGIAWDEEQPPVYEDVPASPPTYSVNDFDMQELDRKGSGLNLT